MRWTLAIMTALSVVAAACGAPPTTGGATTTTTLAETPETTAAAGGVDEVLAALEGLSGEERKSKLVELAEEEGDLSLYTSMTGDVVQEVVNVFEDAYGIDVAVYRAASETVLQRLVEEARASFAGADLVETNGTELFALSEEGILLPVESPVTEGVVEGGVYDGWTATRFNIFAVSWNTDLVAEPPTSWEDFADPAWDGRIAMEQGDIDWYMALHDYWVEEEGKSEDEAAALFEQIADGAVIVRGHTVIGQLLAAGEFDVALSNYSYIAQGTIYDGAPVAWQPPVEPLFPRPNGIGFIDGLQHPAAALLYYEWFLSDGQEVLPELGIDPSRRDLLSTGEAELYVVDLVKFAANRDDLQARYDELIGLGTQLED